MENTNQSQKIKLDFKDSKYATGRRKTSIAKVWLKKGTGKIYVNGKTLDDYFTSSSHKMQIMRPFDIINQSTDCLLYTSPSPRDISGSRMPSSA